MVWTCDEEKPDALVPRKCEMLDIVGTRKGRGRPKEYSEEVIRQDLMQLQIVEDMP